MRVLLTGASGFVGRAVAKCLNERGDEVAVLSRRKHTSGPDELVLGAEPWTQAQLSDALAALSPDAVIHMAGARGAHSPEQLYEANTLLGLRLMTAMEASAPGARLTLIGSAAEYGPPHRADGLVREDDACRPVTPYGISKLAQTLHGLAKTRDGLLVTVARLFNPIGRDMPDGLVFSDIAARIASGTAEIEAGNIDVSRDFLAVSEAARIIVELTMEPAAIGQVVNVCSGLSQPLSAGIERLIARSGRPVRLVAHAGLARGQGVTEIRGSTARLEALGIAPASADIGAELDALMDLRLS